MAREAIIGEATLSSTIRWCGFHGFTKDEVRSALADLGVEDVNPATLNTQIQHGRRQAKGAEAKGNGGELPDLSDEDAARLMSHHDDGEKAKASKSKASKPKTKRTKSKDTKTKNKSTTKASTKAKGRKRAKATA